MKYLVAIQRADRTYTYFRRGAHPLIRMPDAPRDSATFLAAYAEALAETAPEARPSAGTIGALIEAALASERYLTVGPVYRATLRRQWDAIRMSAGTAPHAGLRPRHLTADLHAAENPHARWKAWRWLCAWARSAGLMAHDPTAGVTPPRRPKTSGHPTWSPDHVAAFRARWPIGTTKRMCMELLYWTGARVSDGVTLGPGMLARDGVLTFRQSKTGDLTYIPWTCPLPSWATDMSGDREMMHAAIAAAQTGHMTYLATTAGRPRTITGLKELIARAAREAGIPRSAHGLRKARATALAEAGATTHQIAAWTGHRSLSEVEHYTLAASRRQAVMGIQPATQIENLQK